MRRSTVRQLVLGTLVALAPSVPPLCAGAVPVRHEEGLVHGFLKLSTVEGQKLADGDLFQTAKGDRVTSRLKFRFRDGSSSEETTVFTQREQFRLVSHQLVQKGPAFPRSVDSKIDVESGQVTIRFTEKGEEKVIDERMELPPDLANGMILTLLKNVSPETPETVVSMLAMAPKPMLVKLKITPGSTESFATGGTPRKATRFVIKVDIPGVKGIFADLMNKTPPDSHVWILGGQAPAFVQSESPFFVGGPLWRIELVSPQWAKRPPAPEDKD